MIIIIMFVLIFQPVNSSWDQTTLSANHVSCAVCSPPPLRACHDATCVLDDVLTDMEAFLVGRRGPILNHTRLLGQRWMRRALLWPLLEGKDGQCLLNVSVRVHVLLCSLEAQKLERVPAGVKPARGLRPGAGLLRIHPLLSLLQAAAGWTLQAAALQTSECCGATSRRWGGLAGGGRF